jgi:hypothetical protein
MLTSDPSPTVYPVHEPHESAASPLRIARTILNLGVAPSFVRSRPGERGPWEAHEEALLAAFNADPQAYLERLVALAEQAKALQAELIIFPACTFYHQPSFPLARYIEAMPAGLHVLSGTLGQDGPHRCGEGITLLRDGQEVLHHDSGVCWASVCPGWSLMSAESSTITEAREDRITPSNAHPPREGSPLLLVDMGHHQYSGRYTRTLTSVTQHVARRFGVPALTTLSYWKYRHTWPKAAWTFPIGSTFQRERHTLAWGGLTDLLDLLDVSWSGDAP